MLRVVCSNLPDPAPVGTNVGLQAHFGGDFTTRRLSESIKNVDKIQLLTEVVRTDLQSLVASHNEPNLLGLLVLKQTDVSSATFLPLGRLAVETEELGAPAGYMKPLIELIYRDDLD